MMSEGRSKTGDVLRASGLSVLPDDAIDGDLSREQTCRYVYMSMNTNSCGGTWWKKTWGKLGIGLVAGLFVYLAIFHWYYVAAYRPFLFLLACPLSHLFMHHGQGGGHGCCGAQGEDKPSPGPTKPAGEKP